VLSLDDFVAKYEKNFPELSNFLSFDQIE